MNGAKHQKLYVSNKYSGAFEAPEEFDSDLEDEEFDLEDEGRLKALSFYVLTGRYFGQLGEEFAEDEERL